MIGLDTNVVVRLLVGDDARQASLATKFMSGRSEDEPAFISAVVLAEIAWVLEDVFGYPQPAVVRALLSLFESSNLMIEREQAMKEAIALAGDQNADISDSVIARISLEEGASHIVTFDIEASKRVPGMELLK